jgi:CHAT domain
VSDALDLAMAGSGTTEVAAYRVCNREQGMTWAEEYGRVAGMFEEAQRAGSLARLDAAAAALTGLLRTSDDADLAIALVMQAVISLTRHAMAADPPDLHRAVLAGLRAASLCGRQSPEAVRRHRAAVLGNLANTLRARFEVLGDIRDLGDAIALGREALAAGPADAYQERRILSNLSLCLRIRCQLMGSLDGIDEAIALGERGVALLPPGQGERGAILSNLGGAYQVKHELSGDLEPLAKAIECGRGALLATSPDDPLRAYILSNLASALQIRAERLGHSQDIVEAVEISGMAVAVTPADDPAGVPRLANLATAFLTRFDHDADPADLDDAVEAATRAVRATPTADPAFPGRAANLSAALRTRFDHAGNDQDLDAALDAARRAAAAARADGRTATAYLSGLGTALRARYQRGHQTIDAVEAASAFREALAAIPADAPDRAALLSNLGAVLYEHYEQEPEPGLVAQAEDAFRMAAGVAAARPRIRVAASTSWGRIAAERGRWDAADEGLSLAVGLLGSLVPPELDREDQQRGLRRHIALASDAAACALSRGDSGRALVLLEMGRGLLLRQGIDSRADLGALTREAPELARRFGELRRQLDLAGSDRTVDSRREQTAELESLLARIRQLPGFGRFLRVPEIEELYPLAGQGPVVVLNVSELRSDALIVRPDSVTCRALPAVSPASVQAQVARLLNAGDGRRHGGSAVDPAAASGELNAVLSWLWEAIAEPVLAELGLLSPVGPDDRWPQVWWVPTGLLSFLPIHAAQSSDGDCVLDRVVSSYTPTLHTLGFARRRPVAGPPRMLAVAGFSSSGSAAIPAAQREASAIARLARCPADILAGQAATRSSVLAAMATHSWAHFACHATSDPVLPSRSALIVHDSHIEPLTVADITRLDLANAETAFLSACTTTRSAAALTDESIHLTSGFQLAGYRHVVGTLWPVSDPVAIRAARAFYTEVTSGGALAGEQTAKAVHHASQRLRDRFPRHPGSWAAHIHAGA